MAPFAATALRGRCPRCGRGTIFDGLLALRDACPACGLDLRGADTGDGAAAGVVLVLGTLIVGAAIWLEVAAHPPLWLHALIWPILTVPLAIAMIRCFKAGLVWSQVRNRASEMDR